MDKIRLFCFPCAGGSSLMFTNWWKYLKQDIILCPVELAGRGKRFGSSLYKCIQEAIDDIFYAINSDLDKNRYAFFGHSMGCLLAYELIYKIRETKHREPEYLFLAAQEAPHIIRKNNVSLHQLPINIFKNEIIKLGGIPKEVYENEELFDMFIPILKADYKMAESYQYIPNRGKLNSLITTLHGTSDNIKLEHIQIWSELTNRETETYSFKGGHFF